MRVKTIYMDLVEGVKKGDNVWKLESEAFKKPIKVEIGYDEEEKKWFNDAQEEIKGIIKTHVGLLDKLEAQITDKDEELKAYEEMLCRYEKVIADYEKKINKKDGIITGLLKEVATSREMIDMNKGAIIQLQTLTNATIKKITKQPSVFHGECFISGDESAGLGMFGLDDGDYLMIAKYTIGEHNEYVTNKDEILFDKIHVENQNYVPFYKLIPTTPLDKPTATVYYDLIFMPL